MKAFMFSLGVTCAMGAFVIAMWDHIREEEHRKWTKETPSSSDPEFWDYKNPRSASEYIKNNGRRRNRKQQVENAITQKLFVFSLLFFLFSVGIAGWLS